MSTPADPAPSPLAGAVRLGLRRGLTEFRHMLRSPEDTGWNVIIGVGILVYLVTQRDSVIPGSGGLTLPDLALPGILAATILFGMVMGPAFALSTEVEEGTVLRLRTTPRGTTTYTVGMVVGQVLGAVPMLVLILAPWPFLLGDPMHQGPGGWVAVVGWLLLGTLATLPIGIVGGALAGRPTRVMLFVMAPVVALAFLSGIFGPQTIPPWAAGPVQAFPLYWLAHGLRATTLPAGAEGLELGGAWHPEIAALVLLAWAVVGLVVAPVVLRRSTARQTASALAERLQSLVRG
ncbi:ABC transporter permease [Cellulomonas xiejunii]|uniref:ABC transporter permease n=1 Tax=Cellulomonas xiejunii TaxID=2968083 RepID=A0ABY5KS69_9CELL|nr:ABC transporter permease [Cellulomonas xiejunii]MCC2315050.1 ABC transporter permease [Cellulomonas xiejunii]MCC2321464.1 ABC transporter permease [Cellulomonas xiejunii]MCC2323384.1 ABC transporter permease [Cellulomonas xiejunii]UUI72037.1 ABC transporter permease [Cellulomonas xiejunii]